MWVDHTETCCRHGGIRSDTGEVRYQQAQRYPIEIASTPLFTEVRGETVRKVPEVSETWPLGRLSYAIRPESAPVFRPIRRSERCSHPFSDSLGRLILGSSFAGSCIERRPEAARRASLAPHAARVGTTCSGGA